MNVEIARLVKRLKKGIFSNVGPKKRIFAYLLNNISTNEDARLVEKWNQFPYSKEIIVFWEYNEWQFVENM